MKFDVVIGNPPYQSEAVGKNNQSTPIYNYFYELSEKISRKFCLITPARFLSNQGATPKNWNIKMLKNEKIKIKYFNPKSNEVFPNTDIKGGVVIIYGDEDSSYGSIDVFIPFEELRNIYNKVKIISKENISGLIFSPDSYRLSDKLFEENKELVNRTDAAHAKAVSSSVFSRYPEVFLDEISDNKEDYIRVFGREKNKRIYKYLKRKYMKKHENIDKWKVFVPGANGSGAIGEVLSTPLIGEPLIGHTQSFISIGSFETKYEAESLLKYIKTKFARVMLGVMKTTQNNQSKNTWSKVPLQDFTPNSDIDWTKSIEEIDRQLYKKYNLSQEEIAFIEEKVKAME